MNTVALVGVVIYPGVYQSIELVEAFGQGQKPFANSQIPFTEYPGIIPFDFRTSGIRISLTSIPPIRSQVMA